MPIRISVFASGSGSNFQAIVDAIKDGKLDAKLELLVCDKPNAKVVLRAQEAGIPVFAFRSKMYASREAYESEILDMLTEKQVDLIVLAGYMRMITDKLVKPFYGRMINVHPSLLPSFPGLDAIGQALNHGVKVTGVTVHYVDGGMDTGPIIAQQAVHIQEDDTEESLVPRIHKVEHDLYPRMIQLISEGRVKLKGSIVKLS